MKFKVSIYAPNGSVTTYDHCENVVTTGFWITFDAFDEDGVRKGCQSNLPYFVSTEAS